MTKPDLDEVINRFIAEMGIRGVSVVGAGKRSDGGAEAIHITLEQSIDEATLKRAKAANDHTALVILLNLEIEHQLVSLFRVLLDEPKFSAPYGVLIAMLRTLRFDNGVFEIVDGFRKLRNKFAHEKVDLDSCIEILDSIFSKKIPTLSGQPIESVDGVRISDLPTVERLHSFAWSTILFLAGVNQMYTFPRPAQRFAVISSSREGQ